MSLIIAPKPGDLVELVELKLEPPLANVGLVKIESESVMDFEQVRGSGIVRFLPEKVGPFPARQEMEILSGDSPKSKVIGWTMHEDIGIGVINPRSLGKLGVSTKELLTTIRGLLGGTISIFKLPSGGIICELIGEADWLERGGGSHARLIGYENSFFRQPVPGFEFGFTADTIPFEHAARTIQIAYLKTHPDYFLDGSYDNNPFWQELVDTIQDMAMVDGVMSS